MLPLLASVAIVVGSWLHIPGGTWEPSGTVVAEAAAQIKVVANRNATAKGIQLQDWASYTFQYQGRELSGHRILYINAFCSAPPQYANLRFIRVLDGGSCYFSAYYDPAKKRVIRIVFNGVA